MRLALACCVGPNRGRGAADVAGSSRPGGDADEGESAPQLQSSSAAVEEAAVGQQVAGMMFLELMFWKNQREAEEVREEYNWKVSGAHLLNRYSPLASRCPSGCNQEVAYSSSIIPHLL